MQSERTRSNQRPPSGPGSGPRWTLTRRGRRARAILVCAVVALAAVVGWRSAGSPAVPGLRRANPGIRVTASGGRVLAGEQLDTGVFATGSCVLFKPSGTDRHQTVFLDAGHGGLDPGAVGTTQAGGTIYEADETLPVELDAAADLTSKGFTVAVSRTTASTVVRLAAADTNDGVFSVQGVIDDLAARDECANRAGASILIGIYFDAGAPSKAGSVTGYDAVRPFAQANLRLANLVQSDVLASMNARGWAIPDDGVVVDSLLGGPALSASGAAYGHLQLLGPAKPGIFSTPSRMPGTLIEPLYITDPFEGSIAASTTGQQAIALGLTQAVQQYLGPAPAS